MSVVMITRDRRPEVLRTLDLMMALPERPPILVVDNGSSDGTADAVAAAHPPVRLIRSPENLGAVAHIEHGLRLLEEPQRTSPARRYVG